MKSDKAEFVRAAGSVADLLAEDAVEVAFAGRSNVGKSSLLNRLLGKPLARTSRTPGRTQTVNYFRLADGLYFVDLPGYGWARVGRDERQRWAEVISAYLERPGDRLLIQLVDARVGATDLDIEAATYFAAQGLERLVVATKIDGVKRGARARQMQSIADALKLETRVALLAVSAESGEGVRELWKSIEQWEPIAELSATQVSARKTRKEEQSNA